MTYQRIPYEDLANSPLAKLTDIASSALGSEIVEVTDEFFAPASNMINPLPPVHAPGKFVSTGAWMDGWETKRHNQDYDRCIIKLGFAGTLRGFDIDTSYFTGNQAPAASVDGCFCPSGKLEDCKWVEILPKESLPPSSHNVFVLDKETTENYTHLRVNNYPDGGIARFRAYGNITPIFPEDKDTVLDLAFVGNGGRSVFCTNEHYTPASHLLLPGRGSHMGHGWETKRSRIPGYKDYAIFKLGAKGHLVKAVIDTSHYKGNYPHKIILEGTESQQEIPEETAVWTSLIEPSSVGAHGLYYYDLPSTDKAFTHVRFTIVPDGGAKRLRLYGVREGGKLPLLPLANPQFEKFDDEVNGNGN